MEKNGNTLSPGNKVVRRDATGTKTASPEGVGEVQMVDIPEEHVLVKWASGSEEWVPLAKLEHAEG